MNKQKTRPVSGKSAYGFCWFRGQNSPYVICNHECYQQKAKANSNTDALCLDRMCIFPFQIHTITKIVMLLKTVLTDHVKINIT